MTNGEWKLDWQRIWISKEEAKKTFPDRIESKENRPLDK